MSKVNKRKHVMKEMQTDDFDAPESNQLIVRIIGSRGNNLHEVESAEPIATDANNDGDDDSGYRFLVSMPTKFRKNVWVKRGDFVIVEPIDEGDKVKAEIVRILTPQHIKEFTKMGIWPAKFTTKNDNVSTYPADVEDSQYTDEYDDLFVNTNRAHYQVESDAESQDSSDSDSDDDSDESADDSDDVHSDNGDAGDAGTEPNGNTGADNGDGGCDDAGGGDDGDAGGED